MLSSVISLLHAGAREDEGWSGITIEACHPASADARPDGTAGASAASTSLI